MTPVAVLDGLPRAPASESGTTEDINPNTPHLVAMNDLVSKLRRCADPVLDYGNAWQRLGPAKEIARDL